MIKRFPKIFTINAGLKGGGKYTLSYYSSIKLNKRADGKESKSSMEAEAEVVNMVFGSMFSSKS